MSERWAWLTSAAALAAPLALLPLFLRPEVALAVSVLGVLAWLACSSVAYPLALASVPPILFGIFADNPLPEGVASIVLGIAVVLSVVVAVQRRQALPPPAVVVGAPLVLTLLLLCLLILRDPPAPDTNYGEIKTGFFVINNVVFLVGGIFVGWSPQRLREFLLATFVISVAGAVVLVLFVAGAATESIFPAVFTFSEVDHSISMGRGMAVGILLALALTLAREEASVRLVAVAALPLLCTALVASGARGPVVALLIGAMALLGLGLQDRVARRRLLLIVTAAVTAFAMIQMVVPETSVLRSFSFATADVEGFSSGRTEMWAQAVHVIREQPELGIGTGGFADINPPMIYPHNLFLEVGVELGVAGILLVVALLAHATTRMARAYIRVGRDDRITVAALLALFVTAVTNSMFSYALHANWAVWLWAGVGTALAARHLNDRSPRAVAPVPG